MIHTMLYLHRVDLGFATSNRLVMYAHAPAREMAEYRKRTEELAQLTENLRDIPGVTGVAQVVGLPAAQYGSNGSYAVVSKGQAMEQGGLPQADFSLTGPGYFHTMDVPLLRGRDFTTADAFDGAPVAIISAALAKTSFGTGDPIGQQIQCGWDEQSMRPMTIVGIAGDVRQQSPAERAGAVLYMPLRQHPMVANEVQIVLRTSGQPEALIETVRQRTNRFDPSIATQFTTVDTVVSDATTAPRLRSELLSSFAGIGLVLAVIGIYGVMSYSVVQRRSEIGIRMALGAMPASILRLMMGQATRTALLGLGVGAVLSLLMVQTMRSMVVGLSVFDPMTYVAAIALLLISVVCAAAAPARRAASIEPMQALRNE
jgi:predicted permease